jgi:VanZ family protein
MEDVSARAATPQRPRLVRDWLPVLGFLALSFVLSSIPGSAFPSLGIPHIDTIVHATEFAVLGYLLMRLLARSPLAGRVVTQVACALAAASAWGALDEAHQILTPRRTPDVRDWLADSLGALVGVAVFLALARAHRALRAGRSPDGGAP